MNVLSIDTCFDACSASAGRGLRTLTPSIAFLFEPMQKGHAERIVPMIGSVLASTGLSAASIDRIAVTYGPGTFTGARICVSAARALALATGASFVALSSLKLMAMSPLIPAGPTARIAVAVDARRGEVYFELFDRHTLATLGGPCCVSVGHAAALVGEDPIVIAGSGAEAVALAARARGGDAVAILPALVPDALNVLFPAVEMQITDILKPLYLRPPDAKPPAPNAFISQAP